MARTWRCSRFPNTSIPDEIREEPLLPSFLFIEDSGPFAGVLAQEKGSITQGGWSLRRSRGFLTRRRIGTRRSCLPARRRVSRKISPVEASRYLLKHLKDAWDSKHPGDLFDSASGADYSACFFRRGRSRSDAKAAAEAGYPQVILLEEPQAAFYAWIARKPDWREQVHVGDLILVVDIGGGTTDFTLIAVREQAGQIALERIAVGDHILLGGDNMDAALAHTLAAKMPEAGPAPVSFACATSSGGERASAGPEGESEQMRRSRFWDGEREWWGVDQSEARSRYGGSHFAGRIFPHGVEHGRAAESWRRADRIWIALCRRRRHHPAHGAFSASPVCRADPCAV